MANTRANKNPEKAKKHKVRPFIGKCSKCGKKGVEVVKVKNAQMCTYCLTASLDKQSDAVRLLKEVAEAPPIVIKDGFVETTPSTRTMPSLPPVG